LSIGYCNTSHQSVYIDTADTRVQFSSSLPTRFKFLGFIFFSSFNSPTATLGTIFEFKIFDGTTSSDPVLTFFMPSGQVNTMSANQGSYMMMDDNYIQFNNGLYLEANTTGFSTDAQRFELTLFYS
tara:strand:- start:302 stop:679 length:378 start_codon:yes stop_codon:yes gene_type:complete